LAAIETLPPPIRPAAAARGRSSMPATTRTQNRFGTKDIGRILFRFEAVRFIGLVARTFESAGHGMSCGCERCRASVRVGQ
jgi:hypothetical protein